MKKFLAIPVLGLLLLPALSCPALAQNHDDHWHGDIHNFHGHDFDHWRGGNWFHGPHGGRDGWWWIVDGSWYFYPAPVYPYPDPYTPPVVAVAPAPVGPVAYWYYCRNPRGYYPYVPQCFGHWHRVVATTPAPSAVIVQQAPAPVVVQQQPYPAAPPPVAPPPSQSLGIQDQDRQKLDMFNVELSQIDPNSPQAAAKLKSLDKRVGAYRQTLFQRDYNAMGMLKNTEGLQHRIAAARDLAKKAAAHNDGTVPPPAPGYPPAPLTAPPP